MKYQNIPKTVKTLRKMNGYTQEQLAKRCRLSGSEIVQIEHGRWDVRMSTLGKLAVGLNTTAEKILLASR